MGYESINCFFFFFLFFLFFFIGFLLFLIACKCKDYEKLKSWDYVSAVLMHYTQTMSKVENHHNLVNAFGPSRSCSPIYVIANLQIIYFEDFPNNVLFKIFKLWCFILLLCVHDSNSCKMTLQFSKFFFFFFKLIKLNTHSQH